MDKKTDALMLALHHIEDGAHNRRYIRHVIREALAEQPAQQQEPVAVKQIAEALRKHGLTLVKTAHSYHVMDLGRIEALMSVPDGAQSRSDEEQPAQQHDYRIKYDRPCYKCRNNFCPGNCKEPEQPPKHQKPAGYFRLREYGSALIHDQVSEDAKHNEGVFPLYTSPPNVPTARASKPLTDEQIKGIYEDCDAPTGGQFTIAFTRAIEAAHGIKGDA